MREREKPIHGVPDPIPARAEAMRDEGAKPRTAKTPGGEIEYERTARECPTRRKPAAPPDGELGMETGERLSADGPSSPARPKHRQGRGHGGLRARAAQPCPGTRHGRGEPSLTYPSDPDSGRLACVQVLSRTWPPSFGAKAPKPLAAFPGRRIHLGFLLGRFGLEPGEPPTPAAPGRLGALHFCGSSALGIHKPRHSRAGKRPRSPARRGWAAESRLSGGINPSGSSLYFTNRGIKSAAVKTPA